VASGLTLFSGFGLGTLLLPMFALFFPLGAAVAMTAVVHLLNNLFKLILLGRYADKTAVLKFGLPAIAASFIGALVLVRLSGFEPVYTHTWIGRQCEVTPVKMVIAVLIVMFAVAEVAPKLSSISFSRTYLPLGGSLSGFLGGLSGHQGALRSAFLIKCGLTKEAFIATGVVIACLVDVARLGVYSAKYDFLGLDENVPLLAAAVVAAFLGAFIGNRLMHKISLGVVRWIVASMLFIIAAGLGTGVV
jgi:uncharacterized membrane protein YfcA